MLSKKPGRGALDKRLAITSVVIIPPQINAALAATDQDRRLPIRYSLILIDNRNLLFSSLSPDDRGREAFDESKQAGKNMDIQHEIKNNQHEQERRTAYLKKNTDMIGRRPM